MRLYISYGILVLTGDDVPTVARCASLVVLREI